MVHGGMEDKSTIINPFFVEGISCGNFRISKEKYSKIIFCP